MKSGIYVIENNITGHKYVGQGIDANRRMKLLHNNCKALLDAFKKYGEENFSRYVIEYCDESELDAREIFYIEILKTHVSQGGYNISYGGSVPMRGVKFTDEHKRNIGLGNTGKERTQSWLDNMSRSHIGFNVSEETKKKIGDSETGEKHHFWGKKRSNPTSQYLGVSWQNQHQAWQIRVTINKKSIRIGQDKDEYVAALKYDEYIVKNNLPNPLNFPENYS
jgi:group I intron endonuclease